MKSKSIEKTKDETKGQMAMKTLIPVHSPNNLPVYYPDFLIHLLCKPNINNTTIAKSIKNANFITSPRSPGSNSSHVISNCLPKPPIWSAAQTERTGEDEVDLFIELAEQIEEGERVAELPVRTASSSSVWPAFHRMESTLSSFAACARPKSASFHCLSPQQNRGTFGSARGRRSNFFCNDCP